MKTKLGVSVIIPNHNYAEYLDTCIESVLQQTWAPKEILVIDDASTDSSLVKLRKFHRHIDLIRLSENLGSRIARNIGILRAKEELLAFLDSDDYWDKEKLELQFEALMENHADLVFCDMHVLQSEGTGILTNLKYSGRSDFRVKPSATPFPPSVVMVKKNLLARSGIFNSYLAPPSEDFDLFRRCVKWGKVVKVDYPLVFHREHNVSLTKGSHISYFQSNAQAIRIMFAEERRELGFFEKLKIWINLHINFVKHGLKQRDYLFVVRVMIHSMQIF
jgi:glycosyltransferase involved in cell wall biosynthesis